MFGLCGWVPALYAAVLGTLKNGCVFSPLFSAFGPEPARARMEFGGAKVLVTTPSLYRREVAAWRDALPSLEHVLLIDAGDGALPPGTLDLTAAAASSLWRNDIVSNPYVWGALVLCFAILAAAITISPVATILEITPLSFEVWLLVIAMSLLPVLGSEAIRFMRRLLER